LDDATKEAVGKLYHERVHGKFKADRDGFAKAFLTLSENAGYDESKPITA
jgi:hypothetical protein